MDSSYGSTSAHAHDDPFQPAPVSPAAAAAAAAVGSGPDQYELLASSGPADLAAPRSAPGGRAGAVEDLAAQVLYNCGDCNTEQRLERASMMRCRECGGRMFYKQRTKRYASFSTAVVVPLLLAYVFADAFSTVWCSLRRDR